MTSGEYIQGKLRAWAARRGIPLQGSKGDRGSPNYTHSVEKNLFSETLIDPVRVAFSDGAGGELRGDIPTMSALHSSAALAVNLFQYWLQNGQIATLATLLRIPSQSITSVTFEDRFPVCEDGQQRGFREPPHLDFAFRYSNGSRVGIECKLFEPYGRLDHKPLRRAYLDLADARSDIPAWRELAQRLAVGTAGYERLGASQLVKHVLGLNFRTSASKVRLVYLYYDAIGAEAAEHRDELTLFEAEVAADPIRFVPLSVQEFILRAVAGVRAEHSAYVDYLAERYL